MIGLYLPDDRRYRTSSSRILVCRCNAGGTAVERQWNAVERGGTQGTEVSDRFSFGFFGAESLTRLEMFAASESR